jgi:hypothetical protein
MSAINGLRMVLSCENFLGAFVMNGLDYADSTLPGDYKYRISHSHSFGKTTKKSVIAEVASE